ncbi:hypothetical protein JQN63_24175 [Delftia lacustris]|uniref:DUF6881 domain-containing protein n=2 Tax=Delftia TaxID=80865 RepID=UPI00193C0E4D|nr:hypothetical protein [Delftia lacustris]QRI89313.1 hypothetical protein JQN63_24175 [Delftia lacustris]
MEKSHRIAQILGVPTAYLYCEDDDLAEVILAWSTLARGGRAQEKKAVLGLVAGRQGERLGSRYDGMSAGWGGKRLLAAYRYRNGRLFFSDDGKRPKSVLHRCRSVWPQPDIRRSLLMEPQWNTSTFSGSIKLMHDPVRLLSELDASRIERRKLEFFKDGTVDAADGNVETERTRLSVEAVPSLGDINRDPQFEGSTITREAFEAQWLQHAADKQLLKAQSGQEQT